MLWFMSYNETTYLYALHLLYPGSPPPAEELGISVYDLTQSNSGGKICNFA